MGGSTPCEYEEREAAGATALARTGEHAAMHAGVRHLAHHGFYLYMLIQYISFIIYLNYMLAHARKCLGECRTHF